MNANLLRIFFDSWLVSFIGVLFSIFLLAGRGVGGYGGGKLLPIVAPFWALLLSPPIAAVYTFIYMVYKKIKTPSS